MSQQKEGHSRQEISHSKQISTWKVKITCTPLATTGYEAALTDRQSDMHCCKTHKLQAGPR
eukprot:812813-Pelagomonas_calceolata.AAC.2